VSEQNPDRFGLPDPPADFVTYPTNTVAALMGDPDETCAAIEDLAGSGFEQAGMFTLVGPEGAEQLDVDGRHHGLRGRLYRFVERVSDERGELLRTEDHLRAGGLLLVVPSDDDQTATAARILKEHGAQRVVHFGARSFEPLGP
jgi:hypothetical protein